MQINWLKTLWQNAKHNAFTDLCCYNNQLFCTFREATNHVSGDGIIRILTLNQSGVILWQERIAVPNADLRDPKLCIAANGELMLIAYARFPDAQNRTHWSRSLVWRSNTGKSWSQAQYFGPTYWWLWRLRWHQGQSYGLAYNRVEQSLDLYKGVPGRTYELLKKSVLGLATHGLGYPNESDLFFEENGDAFAIVRRDADTFTAQLGRAKSPYTQWRWQDLNTYIGSPVFYERDDDSFFIAGREWLNRQPKTTLVVMQKSTGKILDRLLLPSAGDNAYPGLAKFQRTDDTLYLSYYSAHENQRCQIYLAQIAL
ncbi:hypothetical protein [Alteromonas sp. a30]|uniref:hypothetical protein n=1 Tax=Alteromonas sp. a30 TaxID=2730917 RepID=UPI00227E381C|nr:hypothetical protein [Alteromonas sp. a30]MCY7294540.1 hypothetical protein [Alteromonas sp. a30]